MEVLGSVWSKPV